MNNNTKELLTVVMEECAEIQKACSKSIRFGLRSHHPNRPDQSNGDEIVKEFYELSGIIEKLQSDGELPRYNQKYVSFIKSDKLKRMNQWAKKIKNNKRR